MVSASTISTVLARKTARTTMTFPLWTVVAIIICFPLGPGGNRHADERRP